MAYTRIHAVKATVQKALKYICNPDKTDGKLLIDSFACGVETTHYDFMDALSKSSQLKNIRQYLGIEKDGHREIKQHRKQDVSS